MALNFYNSRIPELYFSPGSIEKLPIISGSYGNRVLIVTGKHSFISSREYQLLIKELDEEAIEWEVFKTSGEPSPSIIDTAVEKYRDQNIDLVISIGGGSVIDAGKAISAMLKHEHGVTSYLEGLGAVEPGPEKVPFIAVPTTSGTGSEATKNAVISETGTNGFKKSLRHNNYVPDVALIDPQLILECPPDVTAASGMDALCQLLESFVSLNATEFTDILAFDGLKRVRKSLLITYLSGNDLDARSNMAYGAYISGITLANAGLGTVHGLASPLGGYHNIPHGVVCGTLLAETTAKTVQHLISDQPSHPSLKKYARVGRLFSGKENLSIPAYAEILVESLYELTYKLQIPGLGDYGIKEDDFDRIATSASNKNNPVKLEKSEIIEILKSRL